MIDAGNTRGEINVQPVLRPTFHAVKDRRDGSPPGTTWTNARGVGRQCGCPLRLSGLADQRLPRPVVWGWHPQRTPLGAAACGHPRASTRGRVAIETERASPSPSWGREERVHPLDARGVLPTMVLGHPTHRSQPCLPGLA